jgi:dephospho-CoA kinase
MSNNKNVLINLSENSGILLIGLTGGIASGKSTVSDLLKKMGAEVIDFDQLARLVVAPGKPALNEITETFGTEILATDGNLDRKKLSDMVFKHPGKRRMLEKITHSRISEEFIVQADKIARSKPGAIIMASVPLLIETGMKDLFQKTVVVYISREEQIRRLMTRDEISREKCLDILNAQMPIDDKLKYADYVIRNDRSIEETEIQAQELWQTLKELQKVKRISP